MQNLGAVGSLQKYILPDFIQFKNLETFINNRFKGVEIITSGVQKDMKLTRCSGQFQTLGGAEGSRTPVQTYSSKAFYMLIFALFFVIIPEQNKPI